MLNKTYVILLVGAALLSGCGSKDSTPTLTAASIEAGPAGPQGNAGAQGPQGSPGPGLTVQSSFLCQGIRTVNSHSLDFRLKGIKYQNGDVLTECAVIGPLIQSSDTEYFASTSNAASTYGCTATYDIDRSNGGWWSFGMDTNGVKGVIYHDTGGTQDGQTIVFSAAECSSQ